MNFAVAVVALCCYWTSPIITSDAFTPITTSATIINHHDRSCPTILSSSTTTTSDATTNDEDENENDDEEPPNNSFSKLGLSPQILTTIQSQGWTTPTPIQTMAVPAMLGLSSSSSPDEEECTSLWAEAPTGSGKTAAFALPLLQLTMDARRERRMMNRRSDGGDGSYGEDGGVGGMGRRGNRVVRRNNEDAGVEDGRSGTRITTLILSPTRELAIQTGGVISELIEGLPSSSSSSSSSRGTKSRDEEMEVQVITGGVPLEPQIQKLVQHVNSGRDLDVLVATPGRLVDVLLHYRDKVDTVESELERRLLAALDASTTMPTDDDDDDDENGSYGRKGGRDKKNQIKKSRKRKRTKNSDVSLSLATIEELGINEGIRDGDDGGRSKIGDMARGVQYLVFDEADRLLGDRGFQKEVDELLSLLPRPEGNGEEGEKMVVKNTVRTFLYSATFPEHIQPRVQRVLQRLGGKDAPPPLRLSCSSSFVMDDGTTATATGLDDDEDDGNISARQRKRLERTTQPSAIVQGPDSTIKLRTIRIEERDRTQALKRLILEHTNDNPNQNQNQSSSWDKILVFVSTRYQTEHIARKLRRLSIPASDLHGKLSMDARIRRLADFKSGKTRVLIATDLASRGLDVQNLPVVFNYDLPRSTADFIHRVGRTGRAGKEGEAVTFVTPGGAAQFDLIEKRHLTSKGGSVVVEREVLKGFEPDEERWSVESALAGTLVEGVEHSGKGLAHDQMMGGVKGRRKSKKDRLREQAALEKMRADGGGEKYGL